MVFWSTTVRGERVFGAGFLNNRLEQQPLTFGNGICEKRIERMPSKPEGQQFQSRRRRPYNLPVAPMTAGVAVSLNSSPTYLYIPSCGHVISQHPSGSLSGVVPYPLRS